MRGNRDFLVIIKSLKNYGCFVILSESNIQWISFDFYVLLFLLIFNIFH